MQEVHDLPKPTVAVLNGAAVGAGLDLACACDFRVAADDAMFFCAYTWVGYNPDVGGTLAVSAPDGARGREAVRLHGRALGRGQGEGPRSGLRGRAAGRPPGGRCAPGGRAGGGPSVAIGLAKGLLQTASTRTLAEQLEAEKAAGLVCAETDDHREALAAFTEKRAPVFRGR